MLTLIKVISNAVEAGFRKIKIRRYGNGDVQTASQVSPFGIDAAPPVGMVAVFSETNKKGKPVIIGYLNKSLLAANGEIRLYSLDSDGALATFIWLKADGTMEIGGDADNMVRFSELKTAFDQLLGDHNDLVNAFNTHMHATAGTGPPVPPTPGTGIPATPSIASVDDAKIDEIKTL